MPTYRFNPDKNGTGPFTSSFEVYNPTTNTNDYQKIVCGQTFTTDGYYSVETMKKADVEFISDEPFVSPIICSYTGSNNNQLEVPDYQRLVNIYISVPDYTNQKNCINLYFNNNKDNAILVYPFTGKIFENILVRNIRIINTELYNIETIEPFTYTIAVLAGNSYAFNNN